ncbi:MAG: FAD-dependent monooxygenase [Bauldia sp.]
MPRRSEGKAEPPPIGRGVDVAVVGGGLSGLAAALLAARAGRSTALIAPPRPGDQRTSALFVGSLDLLKRIGVWSEVEPHSAALTTIRIVDATERLLQSPEMRFEASEIGLPAFGYNIPNDALGAAMALALAATSVVQLPAMASGVADCGDRVAIDTAAGSVRARLVVAADGRHSRLRTAAGIGIATRSYPQSGLVATLGHEGEHENISTEFHTSEGPLTLVPLPGRRSSLVWVGRPSSIAEVNCLSDSELATEIERRTSSFLGRISVLGERQVYPINGMRAERMAGHRIALVGEAGHAIPPIGAQGLNLGLRDVAALDRLFAADDPGGREGLADYDRRRRADVTLRAGFVDGLNWSLISDMPVLQGLRGLGLELLNALPPLRRAAMRYGVGPLISGVA